MVSQYRRDFPDLDRSTLEYAFEGFRQPSIPFKAVSWDLGVFFRKIFSQS
jgi:hypothetical protein